MMRSSLNEAMASAQRPQADGDLEHPSAAGRAPADRVRLQQLLDENERLRRLIAALSHDNEVLLDIVSRRHCGRF